MIIFIPAWEAMSHDNFSTDELMGQLSSFTEQDHHYEIMISNYMPQLRYFLHRFNLLESPYHSIFDALQGFELLEQRKLHLEDLSFPDSVSFFHTMWGTWVYKNGQRIGKVLMGDGHQIFEVHHYKEEKLSFIEIYDDRGYLSSCRYYEEGQEKYIEYLDSDGKGIFVQNIQTGTCLVNPNNTRGLKRRQYENIESLAWERMDESLFQKDDKKIIVSVTRSNLSFIFKSPHLPQMTLSFFSNRYEDVQGTSTLLKDVVNCSRSVLVDSTENFNKISALRQENVFKLTPFDTRFTLSRTQELKEEVLFIELQNLSDTQISLLLFSLLDYTASTLKSSEDRRFKIILSTSVNQVDEIKSLLEGVFRDRFPQEMELLEEVPLKEGDGDSLDQEILLEDYPYLSIVAQLWKSFESHYFQSDEELFKIIHDTRVIVDLSLSPNLFLQIAGISAGIPHINIISSEYVYHKENGYIINHLEEVEEALADYLESFKYWNVARAFSIVQIKKYSGLSLYQELCQILGEN